MGDDAGYYHLSLIHEMLYNDEMGSRSDETAAFARAKPSLRRRGFGAKDIHSPILDL
jgi:hypothetical protein